MTPTVEPARVIDLPPPRTAEPDHRVRAAARVLAGESPEAVAADLGASSEQVARWAAGLAEGGAAAVGGVGLARPAVTTDPSVVVQAPVEEYLAVVAHELRTPLTAARAGLSVLAREDLPPALRAGTAELVQARLDELEQLAQDVADAVGVSTGHLRLHPSRVDLAAVLRRACGVLGLARVQEDEPVLVRADPVRVEQMVSRLVRHATRYRGAVAVSARLESVPDGALLTLRCDGVALSASEATGLMEPFVAAARSDGNGLGLYVVRTLAVASGGQVGVAGSAVDAPVSTVFWLLLPGL